jgi:hypothetical protein
MANVSEVNMFIVVLSMLSVMSELVGTKCAEM